MNFRIAVGLVAAALGATDAAAASERASMSLLAGYPDEDGARIAGLAIDLAPGWKTYWRAPGDAGIPPELDFSGSVNLAHVEVIWPAPETFDTYGLRTLGYQGSVVVPLRLIPADGSEPIAVRIDAAYGVCAEICVPEHARLALDIEPDDREAAVEIAAALRRAPDAAAAAGVEHVACRLIGEGAERRFEAELRFASLAPEVSLAVVEGPSWLWIDAVEPSVQGETVRLAADARAYGAPAWVERGAFRLTLLGDGFAIDAQGCDDSVPR